MYENHLNLTDVKKDIVSRIKALKTRIKQRQDYLLRSTHEPKRSQNCIETKTEINDFEDEIKVLEKDAKNIDLKIKVTSKRFNLKEHILITNAYKISKIKESKKAYKAKGYTQFVITEKQRKDSNLPHYQLWGAL